VYHGLQAINFHSFVESTISSDVRDDLEVELCRWVKVLDCISLLLRADCRGDFMALFEKDFKDMPGDEATSTWKVLVFESPVYIVGGL